MIVSGEQQRDSAIHIQVSILTQSFPGGSVVKNPPAMQETWVQFPGLGRSPGEGHSNPLQYSYPENPHGQRHLAGYSPWGCKESDTTE